MLERVLRVTHTSLAHCSLFAVSKPIMSLLGRCVGAWQRACSNSAAIWSDLGAARPLLSLASFVDGSQQLQPTVVFQCRLVSDAACCGSQPSWPRSSALAAPPLLWAEQTRHSAKSDSTEVSGCTAGVQQHQLHVTEPHADGRAPRRCGGKSRHLSASPAPLLPFNASLGAAASSTQQRVRMMHSQPESHDSTRQTSDGLGDTKPSDKQILYRGKVSIMACSPCWHCQLST